METIDKRRGKECRDATGRVSTGQKSVPKILNTKRIGFYLIADLLKSLKLKFQAFND
jgi:hypothetical protein